MPVVIAMLRGINLGPRNRLKMDALRDLCESLKCRDAQTYVQSGNVIFRTEECDLPRLAKRMEAAIEKRFRFRADVVLRTTAELRDVAARNPFAKRPGVEPSKLLVTFLAADPGAQARAKLEALDTRPEELHIYGRELYTYFPNGMARPKMSWAKIERILKVSGTGRNWNSVTKMLEISRSMDAKK